LLDGKDILQQALGAFSAVLFIYLLRSEPLTIEPTTGLIIGAIWLIVVYNPLLRHVPEGKWHFISSIIVSNIITIALAISFGLVESLESLKGFHYFGSFPWLVSLIAVPVAVLFDKKNVVDIISRYFVRTRG